jgi:hypothetical protein
MSEIKTKVCPFFWNCLHATILERDFNSTFRGQCLGLLLKGLATKDNPCDVFAVKRGQEINPCTFFSECNLRLKRATSQFEVYRQECLGLKQPKVKGCKNFTGEDCSKCEAYNLHKSKIVKKLKEKIPALFD